MGVRGGSRGAPLLRPPSRLHASGPQKEFTSQRLPKPQGARTGSLSSPFVGRGPLRSLDFFPRRRGGLTGVCGHGLPGGGGHARSPKATPPSMPPPP